MVWCRQKVVIPQRAEAGCWRKGWVVGGWREKEEDVEEDLRHGGEGEGKKELGEQGGEGRSTG